VLFAERLGDPQCQQPNLRLAPWGHAEFAAVAIGGGQMDHRDA
jgi:hypothetical protein